MKRYQIRCVDERDLITKKKIRIFDIIMFDEKYYAEFKLGKIVYLIQLDNIISSINSAVGENLISLSR